jgi:hypothetical protein
MSELTSLISGKNLLGTVTLVATLLVGRSSHACGELLAGQTLYQGESLSSCDGRFTLSMQTDGNLVLYQSGIGALWATGTNGSYAGIDNRLTMQSADGNLVLYNVFGEPLSPHCYDLGTENEQYGPPGCLPSNTSGHPGAHLAVQDDGNVVVYSNANVALWATNTSATATPPYALTGSSNYVIANPSCEKLTFVEVVIDITEDLVSRPSTVSPSCDGFAFQINANSPPSSTAFVWQQFIFGLDDGTHINGGAINNWTQADFASGVAWGPGPVNLATLATPYTIPAGYKLVLILGTTNGNVTGANWTIVDQYGTSHSTNVLLSELSPPAGALAPINAFQVNLVGPGDGCLATFSSGAGTISYYTSESVSAESSIPGCDADETTGEQSNVTYGGLPEYPYGSLVQSFRF